MYPVSVAGSRDCTVYVQFVLCLIHVYYTFFLFLSRHSIPGPEFESRIRQNEISNSKFNFLNPGDPYHAYYRHKVKEFQEGKAVEPSGAMPLKVRIDFKDVGVSWSSGLRRLTWRCKGRGFESRHGTNVLWQDINLHLLLSTQVLNGYPLGCDRHCWSNSFWASCNAWLGSGDCAHIVCGQALNPMTRVIVYL